VADILREEDTVGPAVREQLKQEQDEPRLSHAFLRGERHAQEVELDARAAPHDREPVVQLWVAGAGNDNKPGTPGRSGTV
jgi:hypothetical protein